MNERTRALVESVFSRDEFERESQRVDTQVWDALAIGENDRVLWCGFGTDEAPIRRLLERTPRVAVIESDIERIRANEKLPVEILRGSTSVIPATPNAFDVALAYHYLHETDPFFHAQIVSELGRVAKRVIVVEFAPPSDLLGKRIAALYSRAKRELGAFEQYQPLDYWRKLVSMTKADVGVAAFAFTRVPTRAFMDETIDLLLATMKAEAIPNVDLEELRMLARRPDTQLLPQTRYVIVGARAGELPEGAPGARELTRGALSEPAPPLYASAAAPPRFVPPPAAEAAPPAPPSPAEPRPFVPPPVTPPAAAGTPAPPAEQPPTAPVRPAAAAAPPGEPRRFVPPPAAPNPDFGFGFAAEDTLPPAAPFAPFAIPSHEPDAPAPTPPEPAQPDGLGWHWEPPDDQEEEPRF